MTAPQKTNRSLLDRIFFAVATRGLNPQRIASYRDDMRRHDEALSPEVTNAFIQIDTKATGLLTHVSLMIAGLGLIIPIVATNDLEITIIIMEIAIYLMIAVGCLRCLSVFHMREFKTQSGHIDDIVQSELIIRRELYSICIRASIIFTLLAFVLLPILYFW